MSDEPMRDVARAIDAVILPDVEVAFCARHLEPFRKDWPMHYGVAIVLLFQHVMAEDRFTEPFMQPNGKADATNAQISERLREVSPLCCFVGDAITAEVTKRAIEGKGAMS